MKSFKKGLLMLGCAGLLVSASVMGTMAYLTSQDAVTNTFTVGKVVITLDEAKVNAAGQPIKVGENGAADTVVDDPTTATRVEGNSYKLMPGHEYTKDPIVRVASGSEDSYLFVKVVNEIAGIEDSTNTVASQMAANGWKAVDGQTGVYVYVGTATGATAPLSVSADTNVTVFEKIKVDGSRVDNTTLAEYANKTITVTAYAVQKDGFTDKTAAEIWSAAGFNITASEPEPESKTPGEGE